MHPYNRPGARSRQSVGLIWAAQFSVWVILACTPWARCQNPPTFHVNVNRIAVRFSAMDKHGTPVSGLGSEEFQVFDNGKQQSIESVIFEDDKQLTFGIVLDTSSGMRKLLSREQELARAVLQNVFIDQKDLAFLITFDANVYLTQDLTSSRKELLHSLSRAVRAIPGWLTKPADRATGSPSGLPGSRVALFDAIYLAASHLSQEADRKVLFIITQGEDTGSKVALDEAISAAQRGWVSCYILRLSEEVAHRRYPFDMKKLARATGGQVSEMAFKLEKSSAVLTRIAGELRSQYTIVYKSSPVNADRGFHKLKIASGHDYRIRAQAGYFPAEEIGAP